MKNRNLLILIYINWTNQMLRYTTHMKTPILITILISLFQLSVYTACSQDPPKTGFQNQQLHDLLVKTVADEKIPGMIAAIVDSNGIITVESAGVRKIGASELITVDDLFHLGSCTKAMTSTLLATLIAEGKIGWETTILDIFPEISDKIHPDYQTVTLHQLVTHRAGIPANAKDWWAFKNLEIKERRLAILKENLKDPSPFKPGEYHYSNMGYLIAGSMAERITGIPWETLIETRLFEPLGMTSAGFGPPGTKNRVDQPWGHIQSNGKWNPLQEDNAEALGPAGRVHCSMEDWAKFIALFIKQENNPVLERSEVDRLIDPIGNYACGWGVAQREWAHGITLTHSGSNTMWLVTVWIAPEINRAFIVGTNSSNEKSAAICDKMIGNLIEINK